MLRITSARKYFYTFSLTLFILSVVALSVWGLKVGIDFTGGSLLELNFQGVPRPANQEVSAALASLDLGDTTIQPVGDTSMILRFKSVDEAKHQEILKTLNDKFVAGSNSNQGVKTEAQSVQPVQVEGGSALTIGGVTAQTDAGDKKIVEERFESIGPSIGAELKTRTFYAIIIVALAIIGYIAWSFRKVGRPVASWKYGICAVIALIHDVVITCGIFAALGHFFNIEVNTPFVAAVLTVFGYSVNDTIVVFDRVRENLRRYQGDFEETVNISLNQTLVRSLNTTLTTLLALLAIYIFGGETIKYFALALLVGITFGAYSSIFVASALLVTWQNLSRKFGK